MTVKIEPLNWTQNQEYIRRATVTPPANPSVRRGWKWWYEPGDFEHGIVYKETAWWAQSPAGDLIEARGCFELWDMIDEIQDALEAGRVGPNAN